MGLILYKTFLTLVAVSLFTGVFAWNGYRYYNLHRIAAIKLTAIPAILTVLVGLLNLINLIIN